MITLENSQKIVPFLWFDQNALEAATFYCSLFKDGKILNESHMVVSYQLAGMKFMAMNGGPSIRPTEAFSMYVNCESQAEIDYFWNALTADGGQESRCGWLKDKFGYSWQIIPKDMGKLMSHPDKTTAENVMNAMLAMNKIILSDLEAAYHGK